MIPLDFSLAIGLFFAVLLLVAFLVWLVSWTGQPIKKEVGGGISRFKRCPYCGHTFMDYLVRDVVVCPLCKSYLEVKMTSNTKNNKKFRILKNESGMILLVAATFIMIIAIVVIGLINRNVTQILSATEHYKQIQAEQLARGSWWLVHEFLMDGGVGLPAAPGPFTINGVTYTITFFDDGMVGARHQYRVRVIYN